MARALSFLLNQAQLAVNKRPVYKIEIFDIRSTRKDTTPSTIGDVVLGLPLADVVGPLDITDFVEEFNFTERGSDFAEGTLGANNLKIKIADRLNQYDPVLGTEARWLQPGNVVVLTDGDESVVETDHIRTFVGKIVGRAGMGDRDREGNSRLTFAAEDRMAAALKAMSTSVVFEQFTLFSQMVQDLAEDDLGLATDETAFGSFGSNTTKLRTTQFVDESPMLSIAKIGFFDANVPRFRGDGKLTLTSSDVSKGSSRSYDDDNLIIKLTRPFSALDASNVVEVLGMSPILKQITQPQQQLATANVTLGFFAGDATIRVQWSDDGTQQAAGAKLSVLQSVTGALIPFGGEGFTLTLDSDGGSRKGVIAVAGAFYGPLVVVLYAGMIAASFIPDNFIGFLSGVTIPIGRLIEMILTIFAMIVLATIGAGFYEILGQPYEWVLPEIRGYAKVRYLPLEDERTVTIENHLVDTQLGVDTIAMRELRRIRARGNKWRCLMRHDLALEADDKFRLADGREFIIESLTRTVKRGQQQVADLNIFETTTGVHP